MYWTRWQHDIMSAQMDGTGAGQLVTGRDHPVGITIDYDASRLYWTDYGAHRICSSNLNGTGVDNKPSQYKYPYGIATLQNVEYVGFVHENKRQHVTTNSWNFPVTRENPCAGQQCKNICVLTTSAFSCV